ncbi:hypothetical protein DY000_02008257 [Brassica cretica]|uniref:Uncharacterized protein n=1 Tax=Brassica cretica TaxID=69181 RepID=A0ABQ7CEN7_BRACR|nr:hypothetical protein DY000_02008257 [Brassica cretica]
MTFPRCSSPVEWSCEVEFSSADICRSAREDCTSSYQNIFLNSSSVAALAVALAAETSVRVIWVVPVDRCPRQFGRYVATWSALDRSLRSDRPSGLVGRYVATDSFVGWSLHSNRPSGLVGRYVATDSFAGWSLCRNRPSGLVGRYVATNSLAGRSLRIDRPSGLVGHYVATGSFADRSLRGDLVWILFRCFMNVFLDYGCSVSTNQPRLVQDFTA